MEKGDLGKGKSDGYWDDKGMILGWEWDDLGMIWDDLGMIWG